MPSERLAAARGAVRDGVAAVEGFAQLLGSRRVGPRGVARALPEVREGCATLGAALQTIEAAIAAEVADDAAAAAAGAVLAHAGAEVARLEAELTGPAGARSKSASIDARQRLALDASVRRAAGELKGALHLVDLLCASLELRPTPIDLADVIRQRSSSRSQGEPAVRVAVVCEDGCAEGVEADARVVGGLIELAVGAVSAAGVASPHLAASKRLDGRVEVSVGGHRTRGGPAAQGFTSELPLRDAGPRALAVARAAARRAGIEITIEGPPSAELRMTL